MRLVRSLLPPEDEGYERHVRPRLILYKEEQPEGKMLADVMQGPSIQPSAYLGC